MMNADPSKILDKKMSRKQFLRIVGVGAIAFTGVSAALRAINHSSSLVTPTVPVGRRSGASAATYGGSVYGGKPRVS